MTAAPPSSGFPALGTTALIRVSDPAALAPARVLLEEELAAIDRPSNRFRADSELARVNRVGGQRARIGPLFVTALQVALRVAEQTGGDVDRPLGGRCGWRATDRDFARVPPE